MPPPCTIATVAQFEAFQRGVVYAREAGPDWARACRAAGNLGDEEHEFLSGFQFQCAHAEEVVLRGAREAGRGWGLANPGAGSGDARAAASDLGHGGGDRLRAFLQGFAAARVPALPNQHNQ